MPPVLNSDKYDMLCIQLKTVCLNGIYTDYIKSLLFIFHEVNEDDTILKLTMPYLNIKLIHYSKQLIAVLGN